MKKLETSNFLIFLIFLLNFFAVCLSFFPQLFQERFFLLMRKKGLSSFEEARRCLKNLFMNISPQKSRPKIVDVRTKDLDQEVTYKALLQDLYFSYREDLNDKREYQVQVDEFNEWYSSLEPGLDHFLVERLILREGYATISQDEAEELRDRYFREPIVIKVVKVD